MSEPLKLLKRLYKEVNNLYRDSVRLANMNQNWNQHVVASKTLSNDAPVEAWCLAEHFLLTWSDWSGLMDRYTRYFGTSTDEFPKSWAQLEDKCFRLSTNLFVSQSLMHRLEHWWEPPSERMSSTDDASRVSRSLYHSLVDAHRRAMSLSAVSRIRDEAPSPQHLQLHDTLSNFVGQYRRRDSSDFYMTTLRKLPGRIRDETVTHFQHYRHANLIVSWLATKSQQGTVTVSSPFRLAFMEDFDMPLSIEQFGELRGLDAQHRSIVDRVLSRIQTTIAELGYENFVDDITSKELVGGNGSVVGSQGVNVIPGHGAAACSPVVLAVTKGDKRTTGFPSVMRQLREHLIRCIGTTKVVIVISDHWRTDMLDDHIGDLRAHHDRGVRFLFLLVANPGNSVSSLGINLS